MKRQLSDTTINYSSSEFTQSKWNTLQQYLPPILFLCRILDSLLSSKSFEVLDPLKYRTKDGVGYQANGKKGVSLIRSRGAIIQAGEIIVNRCKKKSVFSRLQKYNQKLDSAAYFCGRVSKQYISLTTQYISNTLYTKAFQLGIITSIPLKTPPPPLLEKVCQTWGSPSNQLLML